MFRGDERILRWREHHFDARPARTVEHASGRETLWSRSQPFEVKAPPLSRLEAVELPANPKVRPTEPPAPVRLVTPASKWGLDATSVLHLAIRGADGFRVVAAGSGGLAPSIPPPTAPFEETIWRLVDLGLPAPVFAALDATGRNTREALLAWFEAGSPAEGPMAEWGKDFLDWAVSLIRRAMEPTEAETTVIPPAGIPPLPTEKPAMIGKVRVTSTGYDPNGPRVDDPTLGPSAAAAAGRWGIAYSSLRRHPEVDDRSFVSKRAAARLGPLGTTTTLAEMATWADADAAWAALLELGLDPAVPASPNPGLNHLYPTVEPIPDASYRPRCGAFELHSSAAQVGEKKASIPAPPPRPATLPGQLAFSW